MIRKILLFIAAILTSPCWLAARLSLLAGWGEGAFVTNGQILSVFPGIIGIVLRRGYYCMCLESCPPDCTIECGTWFTHTAARIGKGVYFGGRCMVGMCEIGDSTLIGSNVDILSGRRQHHIHCEETPISRQGGTFEKVRIGSDVWIGNGAIVMADVGDNSVIGAGSVVVKPIPPNSVAAGNPAVVKKTRC